MAIPCWSFSLSGPSVFNSGTGGFFAAVIVLSRFGDLVFAAAGQVFPGLPVKYLQVKGLFQVAVKAEFPVCFVNVVVAAKGNDRQAREMRLDPVTDLFARVMAEPAIQQDEPGMMPPDHIQDVLVIIGKAAHLVAFHLQSEGQHLQGGCIRFLYQYSFHNFSFEV